MLMLTPFPICNMASNSVLLDWMILHSLFTNKVFVGMNLTGDFILVPTGLVKLVINSQTVNPVYISQF